MLANQRQTIIKEQLDIHHSVTVSELVKRLDVSAETIRRDLEEMEKQHILSRVHGGAVSLKRGYNFEEIHKRVASNTELKCQLSETAMNYIQDGDIIAVDSGSTTHLFAKALKERQFQSLSVITFSPEVYSVLADCTNYKITLAGGDYLPKEKLFYGYFTNAMMNRLFYTKAFVVPSAISLEKGIHDFIPESYENQRTMIEHANEVFILADSTKFETTGILKICDVKPEYTIITDKNLPDSIYQKYIENNVNLVR